jgi:hypothetical protein
MTDVTHELARKVVNRSGVSGRLLSNSKAVLKWDELVVEVRKDSDRFVAADGAEDRPDRIIAQRPMQIVGARLGIAIQPVGISQRIRGFDHFYSESLFDLPLASQVATGHQRGKFT